MSLELIGGTKVHLMGTKVSPDMRGWGISKSPLKIHPSLRSAFGLKV